MYNVLLALCEFICRNNLSKRKEIIYSFYLYKREKYWVGN